MKQAIDYCIKNRILVFDGFASQDSNLTEYAIESAKFLYKKCFNGKPNFYFESDVPKEILEDIGVEHNHLQEEVVEYFYDNDESCLNRDNYLFLLVDLEGNGILGCYTL